MSETATIERVEVLRDEDGYWTHPAYPESEDEGIPKSWFTERGLELTLVEFEYDAPEDIQTAYYEGGAPDVSKWEPSWPAGQGWFVFSIHDTEDGPICVWVRPIQQQAQPEESP